MDNNYLNQPQNLDVEYTELSDLELESIAGGKGFNHRDLGKKGPNTPGPTFNPIKHFSRQVSRWF
ncbi:MAG: hypothetical protein AB4062_15090 [Crocosphaera sp.]